MGNNGYDVDRTHFGFKLMLIPNYLPIFSIWHKLLYFISLHTNS